MSITAGSTKRLDIGRVLADGLGALSSNFGPFFLLALLLEGLPAGIGAYGQIMSKANAGFGIFTVAGGAATIVTSPMLQAALIYGTMRMLEGRPASISDCLTVARKNWLKLLGLAILTGLGFLLGFLLLFVPGILLLLRWSVAAPLVVMEGRGIREAMGRSVGLTRNHRWSIFLLVLIFIAVIFVIEIGLAVLSSIFNGLANSALLATYLSPLINTVTVLISYPVVAALFRHLRGDGDDAAPDQLAEVFA